MTDRRRTAAAAVACFSCLGSPVLGQSAATLGMSASLVEYEGFLLSGAATLSPALRYDTPDLSLGAQGSWTVFESGNQILQATAAAAWLTPPRERWRIELSGAAGASRYADQPTSGHILARGRLHFYRTRTGAWAGAATGASAGDSTESSFEVEAGIWTAREPLALVGTVTATWLGEDRHIDLLGAARWTRGRVELETRAGVRPWTVSGGGIGEAVTGVFGEVSALVSLSPRIALALSGGSYPSDPVRRVLAARYVTAGLRLAIVPPAATPIPLLTSSALAAARERVVSASANADAPRLEVEPSGEVRMLRVHAEGAATVEIMGDFTDWRPVALSRVDGGIWEVRLPLTPGVHRLNVRIDGGEWLVPAGARPEPGEFGGAVGVIVVR